MPNAHDVSTIVQYTSLTNDNGSKIKIAYKQHKTLDSRLGFMFLPGLASDMHGRKGTKILNYCIKKNFNCLQFDYSGHGMSEGEYKKQNMTNWYHEALHILEKATHKETILIASSMGAWLAMRILLHQLSQTRKSIKTTIFGLILLCPAINFTSDMVLSSVQQEQMERQGYLDYEGVMLTKTLLTDGNSHLITDKEFRSIHIPVTIIHGCQDTDVNYQDSIKLAQQLMSSRICTLHLLPYANHRMRDAVSVFALRAAMNQMIIAKSCD